MAFDLELECAKARERVHRGIGQRWRHAKAETKRMADAARAEIGLPTYERTIVSIKARNDMLDSLMGATHMSLHTGYLSPGANEAEVSGGTYARNPGLQWQRSV